MYNGIPIITFGKRTVPIPYGMEAKADNGINLVISPSVGSAMFISGISASGVVEVLSVVGDNTYPTISPPAENVEVDSTDIGGLFDGLIIKASSNVDIKLYGWEVVW